jgi:hypothetical protein
MLQDQSLNWVLPKKSARALTLYSFHIIDPALSAPHNHVTFTAWGDLSVPETSSCPHVIQTNQFNKGRSAAQ